jgi:uncharacterized protein
MNVEQNSVLDDKMDGVAALCRKYNVRELYLFGSALRGDFSGHSDLDLAAAFTRHEVAGSFDQYFDFKAELEHLLGRSVDLVCLSGIRNRTFRRELDRTKKLIYAA